MNLIPYGRTFRMNGLQLTSAIDRQREAAMLAKAIPEDATDAWVYGPALGDVVLELLKRDGLRVHVVRMVEALPVSDFGSDRVAVHRASDLDYLHTPFVASPTELRFADESAWHIRDRVYAALNDGINRQLFEAMHKKVWVEHEKANAARAESDEPVKALYLTDDRPAIVIGGGPTAALYYDWIRAQDMNVIACSTALIPLLKAGIDPDVVVCIDRDPQMERHFRQRSFGALVYDPMVEPSIPATWPGKRYVVREGELFCGGSVIHHQLDLATRMGAKTVYLVGADFCYPGGQSHMAGAALPFDASDLGDVKCINGHRERVRTDQNLAQYRVFVEDFARVNAHVEILKLGRDGAECRHVRWFDGT